MENKTNPKPETFVPAGTRILVLPDDAINKSAGGIMLAETSIERPQTGTVISIGPNVTQYKPTERVLYGKTAGVKIDFEVGVNANEQPEYLEHWLMQESELFGTL